MKLVVGLGNPGIDYANTRHNVGWKVVDELAKQLAAPQLQLKTKFEAEVAQTENIILAKPQTFMNLSGRAVRKLTDYYRISETDIWLIHDDLDITWGDYKIQLSKGPKIHNGVNSVEQTLGTIEFWRVRVGIDNRTEAQMSIPGRMYVLKKLSSDEASQLQQIIFRVAAELINRIG